MRYIGVDLHTTQITVCYMTKKEEVSIKQYALAEIEKFVLDLKKADEIAVEATGNTRRVLRASANKSQKSSHRQSAQI